MTTKCKLATCGDTRVLEPFQKPSSCLSSHRFVLHSFSCSSSNHSISGRYKSYQCSHSKCSFHVKKMLTKNKQIGVKNQEPHLEHVIFLQSMYMLLNNTYQQRGKLGVTRVPRREWLPLPWWLWWGKPWGRVVYPQKIWYCSLQMSLHTHSLLSIQSEF